MANPAIEAVKANVGAMAAARPLRGKKKLVAHSMDNSESDWLKILAIGPTGGGKNYALAKLLEADPDIRIFVASTDIGGNGMRSTRECLARDGRLDCLARVSFFEFNLTDFGDWEAFLTDPSVVDIVTGDGKVMGFWEYAPTLLVWDGMSNWQERRMQDILKMDASREKNTELRQEGLFGDMQAYGALRSATMWTLDTFLMIHNPNGSKIHKYVTCLEDDGSKVDKLTGETKRGPLIMGAARSYMGPAFDLILEMKPFKKPGTKEVVYKYLCEIGGQAVAKTRGLPVLPEEEADFGKLFLKINGTRKD